MKQRKERNREPLRGVLFDKDGTLLDFTPTWLPAYRAGAEFAAGGDGNKALRMLAATGYEAETESFRPGSLLASGTTEGIVAAWREFGLSRPEEEMIPHLDRLFADVTARSSSPFPGIGRLLAELTGRRVVVGVATNDSEAGARDFVRSARIETHVSFIAGYDSGHGSKPDPGMIEAFCAAHGLPPGAVAFVGDNHCDMETGRNAGAGYVVGVLSGNGTRAELEPLADAVIDHVTAFPGLGFLD